MPSKRGRARSKKREGAKPESRQAGSWLARLGGAGDAAGYKEHVRYAVLCIALVCQLATVLISWSAWNVREQPINLHLVPLPQFSFGVLLVLTLLAAFFWPRGGVIAHAVVLAASCLWDQHRLQPQVLSLAVMMFATQWPAALWLASKYLAAMWLWAGVHKLLSEEWFGYGSWLYLQESGLAADAWHVPFAALVAGFELGLGVLALFAPRRAAVWCIVLHLGVLLSVSPLLRNHNPSVWPWNLATALVGAWILRQELPPTNTWMHYLAIAVLLIVPAGFYADLVNPHLAFVLYSGNLPRALHTAPGSTKRLDGWTGLAVPFPDSPWLFLKVFELTASAGDKLFIGDPRWGLPDRYFLMTSNGRAQEISRERFLRPPADAHEVSGREVEDAGAAWRLQQAGVELELDGLPSAFAARLKGPQFTDHSLALLPRLPNLRAVHLESAAVSDRGLAALADLPHLEILEVKSCPITGQGLSPFAGLTTLHGLHLEDVAVTSDGLALLDDLRQLEVLHLRSTKIDDRALTRIGRLKNLTWLDLANTRVTSAGLVHLRNLPKCTWLDLAGTKIDDDGLASVGELTSLEILHLSRTQITDRGLLHLRGLANCQHLELESTRVTDAGLGSFAALTRLRYLDLRDTDVSRLGIEQLQQTLPECRIAN